MKIKNITAYVVPLALTKPYTIAFGTYESVENVIVTIELANGMVGMGACSPSEEVIGETAKSTLAALNENTLSQWIGKDIAHFQGIISEATKLFQKQTCATTALDIALHDAFTQYIGVSLCTFWGQKISSLPTSVTIGIKNVTETLKEAEEYKQMGFRVLKVKTGLDVIEDVERILKLREKYANYFNIRVDANMGYSVENLLHFVKATQPAQIELIEQPFPPENDQALRGLPTELRKIIAADESLKNVNDALRLINSGPLVGIFNIKLMKSGGLLGAKRIAEIADVGGVDLMWGCNDESIISISAALHLALSCPNTRYLDLDGSLDLAEDVVNGGFILKEGMMRINEKAVGLGVKKC